MSLSKKIADVLAKAHVVTPETLAAEIPPHRLRLEARAASLLGVELDSLDFQADGSERSIDELRAWGERLGARVTYLMEPLVVLEVDPEGGEVELRSKSVTRRDGNRNFYEARLNRGGRLNLTRQAFDESTRRRHRQPFQLSREVLERLVDDLVDTAG